MTDLKTLKDLETKGILAVGEHDRAISEYDLRQEAIKWIKYFNERKIKSICGTCSDWHQCSAKQFINFFNITEEDLKEW